MADEGQMGVRRLNESFLKHDFKNGITVPLVFDHPLSVTHHSLFLKASDWDAKVTPLSIY